MRLAILCAASVSLLTAADSVPLFNGKDLTGWKFVGPGRFTVENGMLKTEGGMGLLYYTGQKVGNQTLRVVFKTTGEKDNSGVFIRMPEIPLDERWAVNYGYEVQIAGSGGDEWHGTGSIYSISKVTKRKQKPVGEWNTMDIQLEGPATRILLNGELVGEYTEGQPVPERKAWYEPARGRRPDFGYVGLQNHHTGSTVYFKEVSLLGGSARPVTEVKTLAQGDRDRGLAAMSGSGKMLLEAVRDLSPEQWNYKPAADRWSIAEIMEHLVLSETGILQFVLASLDKAPAPGAKSDVADDEGAMARMRDRSQKAQAPEMLRPSGKWKPAELAAEFKLRRDYNTLWLRDTPIDLRGHLVQNPGRTVDAYQMLMMIPGHTERHLAQINEVKASPGFPKR